MSLIRQVKALLPRRIRQSLKVQMGIKDMEARLRNLRRAGFKCNAAVDGGAFQGEWSALAHDIFACDILAVEPQATPELDAMAERLPIRIERVAISDKHIVAEPFLIEGTNSRIHDGDIYPDSGPVVPVRVDRLDAVLDRHPELLPNLLKLDLQGGELRALQGAGDRLGQFEVIVSEVSIIRIGDVPVFKEITDFLHDQEFRLYDIIPAYYRPLDGALWQADAFYVRIDSPLVASLSWD